MRRLLGGVIVCAALLPPSLCAQGVQFTVGGVVAQEIVQSHVDPASDRFTGLVLGGEGAVTSDRFVVLLRYGEGRINPTAGSTAAARNVVDGEALFGFHATPWLTLWAGPSARAYTMGTTNERWLIWTGRVTARGTLLPGRMQSFVELWGAASGSVGSPPLKVGGRGANAGLEVRLGQESPFWGRLGYRMQSTHAPGLRETVESLTLSVLYGFPQ